MVFAGPGANGWVLAPDDDARGAIVDLDGPGGDRRLAGQRQLHPRRPLILLALKPAPPQVLGSDLQVLKPVQVKELVGALVQLRDRARPGASPVRAEPEPQPVPVPAELALVPVPAPVPKPIPVPVPKPIPVPVPKPIPVPAPAPAPAPARSKLTRPRLLLLPGIDDPPPTTATEADVVRAEHAELPASHYDPNRYLQGLVVQACRAALSRDQAVHVDGLWPTITLLPSTGTAIIAGGKAALDPHATLPDLLSSARLTFTPAPRFSPSHPDAMPLEALIWQLALAASRGRLPAGTPLDRSCALGGWPNFTRLAPAPGAMGIAALWTQAPHTLLDTARTLRLPHSHVFSFYSAADALGLVVDDHDPPPPPPPPPARPSPAPTARPGFLRRAFARLHVG